MGPLIGRAKELRECRAVLESSRRQQVARLLRIAGAAGVGKTAIARAILAQAADTGWLTIFAPAHRIQSTLPLIFAKRVQASLIAGLAQKAARYTSGLDLEDVDASLLRLLEAVALDQPIVLVADDAQWADIESRTLITRVLQALADRPIVLISTERIDDRDGAAFELMDAAIAVDELSPGESEALARLLLPGASEPVIAAVVEHGRGRAIDIVALASSPREPAHMSVDDVTATLRALIARRLALFDVSSREFLQICSLISEPIDWQLLQLLWPDQHLLLDFINRFSGEFLIQRGDALYFVHSAISQSVRETIAIEIPFRRRIFDAIKHLSPTRLEDIERCVEQARAMSDFALEKAELLRLLEEAQRLHVTPIAARATERLLAIMPFTEDESIALYTRLAIQYNALSRDRDTHRVCTEALNSAFARGITKGLGQLILSDLYALFFLGNFEEYDRTIDRYKTYVDSPLDCSYLAIGKLFRSLFQLNVAEHDAAIEELNSLHVSDPELQTRIDVFDGMHAALKGDVDRALRLFAQARTNAQLINPLLTIMANAGELMMTFQAFGPAHPLTRSALDSVAADVATSSYFRALTLFEQGSPIDAMNVAIESLVRIDGTYVRRHLLGVAAMASILCDEPLPPAMHQAVTSEATPRKGEIVGAQLAAAAYASYSNTGAQAAELLDAATAFLRKQPPEPMMIFYPVVLVEAAHKRGVNDVLNTFADSTFPCGALPMHRAHYELARLAALRHLQRDVHADDVATLFSTFTSLGSTYFAERTRGLEMPAEIRSSFTGTLTRREREVAALVADGLTNREIAERLVLSERTVEAHIANVFAKIGVSSRSQVATWFVRQATSTS